jgi:hypothetical protein
MQARKESVWRQLLGVTYALTVVFAPGEGQMSISLGGHEWVDAAVSGAIGLVAVPPVLLGTAYGIWKENQLDREVWQVIDKAVSASEPERTPGQVLSSTGIARSSTAPQRGLGQIRTHFGMGSQTDVTPVPDARLALDQLGGLLHTVSPTVARSGRGTQH